MEATGPEVFVLPPAHLEPFLERYRLDSGVPEATDPCRFIGEVLRRANAFVPSEAGSVLLDNPFERASDPTNHSLYFIAAFGPAGRSLLGASIPTNLGVVGHVYRSGVAHLVTEAARDPHFLQHFDETLAFRTRSLLAVPIRLQSTVCGVLELVNRREERPFNERDQDLLEIFAAYTSLTMQTLLDAKRAGEAARSDDLTGLGNDRFFHRRLAAALEHADSSGGRVALLFMDLDDFKRVNDTHGHLAGSQVLKEIGYVLRRVVRVPGATLARYGGDEFVVIIPGFDLPAARRVAEDVRQTISRESYLRGRFSWADGPVNFAGPLTCSIGVAVYPDNVPRDGSSDHRRNQLLRASDQAMYAAKAAGKNLVLTAAPASI